MADSINIVSVVGARPQFVKLAPIARAIAARDGIEHRIIHTGQHYDENMSASFFEQLQLPKPDVDLEVGSGSHAVQTAAMLTSLETDFCAAKPDAVFVYGDTNSTLAATLAAAKLDVPIAHIEAGLRSFNRTMPEEINRLVADHCGDRLYAPTPQAMKNLDDENLTGRSVFSGDVMRDAVLHNIELSSQQSTALTDMGIMAGEFGLVTVHRPVNTTGDALAQLLAALEETASRYLPLVFPVHPRTRSVLDEMGYESSDRLMLVDPLPYLDNISLIQAAALVITDSGGVQKEAAFLRTPCLTMRSETEWTETVEIGVNRLVGDGATGLVENVGDVVEVGEMFHADTLRLLDEYYGDGDAAGFIVDDCRQWIGT